MALHLTLKIMKKYLLSAALLIAVSISAQAQFSLGVKGGVNFSKINAELVPGTLYTDTGTSDGMYCREYERRRKRVLEHCL